MNPKIPPNIRFRRNFIIFSLICALCVGVYKLLTLPVSTDFSPSFGHEVSLLVVSGSVEYRSKNINTTLTATSDLQMVDTGATISVGPESEAILHWGMIAKTQLYPDTQVMIRSLSIQDDAQIGIDIHAGKITNEIVSYIGPEGSFDVSIPKKKMTASVRGSAFALDYSRGVISSLEHVVTLKSYENDGILIGEGSDKILWSSGASPLDPRSLSYRREVQESLYAQYREAQSARPWWQRVIAQIQSVCGLDPERSAHMVIRPNDVGEPELLTRDAHRYLDTKDALRLAILFQNEALLAETGEQLLKETSDPRLRSLYARDITLHLYYQSMDALKQGKIPDLATLKILITHIDLQKYLLNLPAYFASYAPNIKGLIASGAASSPIWREFIRVIDTGVLRAQDISRIRSLLPSSPFDLLK